MQHDSFRCGTVSLAEYEVVVSLRGYNPRVHRFESCLRLFAEWSRGQLAGLISRRSRGSNPVSATLFRRWCLRFDGTHLVSHSLICELVSKLMLEVYRLSATVFSIFYCSRETFGDATPTRLLSYISVKLKKSWIQVFYA